MHLERLLLTGFRCFGPQITTIDMTPGLTAFVGVNGSGKTAVMQALLRLFGVTQDHRRVRRQDFHVPSAEAGAPAEREFVIEAILSFPELDGADGHGSVPEFFHQMACEQDGRLKCRLRLEGRWTDDGSLEGVIEQKYQAIRALGPFEDSDRSDLRPTDRARIQMIYVPASRDGTSQVTAFLRGRLWRAITWSQAMKEVFLDAGGRLNGAFGGEAAVDLVAKAVERRWQQVHSAGTDTKPVFRPVDLRFQEFIRKVEVVFHPDEEGRDRSLEDLSDGQRSLFHLAMTAAALDVEERIADGSAGAAFQAGGVPLPALTLIAIEEPENNLAPFYLSRIVRQIEELTAGGRAQAFVSSHSASILARVDPQQVRHFRLEAADRTARVKGIRLPTDDEDAAKFVREAVRTYPELYFARFVILGEGATEEVVLPRLAEALNLPIDRSFVAMVPLGGRHVNHLWRLLSDLAIPYATLLDLDWGRNGGDWGRIKTTCEQLVAVGRSSMEIFGAELDPAEIEARLTALGAGDPRDTDGLRAWITALRRFGVFFSTPLDLDYSMLTAFMASYQQLEPGMRGPRPGDARTAVLGDEGKPELYDATFDTAFLWYRYLFLGRGKPSTHVRVLARLDSEALKAGIPEELRALLDHVIAAIAIVPLEGAR
ncbi:ATP-dependent nuclease [Methylobacterium radiotolerans]|uniref:ATP-dependent nuclease n=1 Tax=Methylobacterium radiotolerans TaxID=31998 RepID=UPI0015F41F48|nr:AAA family ATPase [Methylobacterium radiotolerans]